MLELVDVKTLALKQNWTLRTLDLLLHAPVTDIPSIHFISL